MEPAQHIAFLSAQLAQTKASLRYQTACAEAAERRLRAFERTRVGGFMGPTSTFEGSHSANQTPLKSCASHHTYGSPRSFFSENASTQPYDSPSRCCVVPQNPCSRKVHALRELRQDAEDVENLQRELELHTTISPDFLAELQRLWRNYTEATDEVISVAISKAQEEGVRQALEGLRRELRQGSVYPTYELARSGSSSKSPCLPVCPPILTTPSEASTASQSSTIITHSPRSNARSLSLATHSDRCSNWPQSSASSDDDSCEECDAKWEAQSVHVSPLFLVERKAAEAAAAVRACRPQAISEPDIDQAAPLIASSCADCKVFKKSGQQECEGYKGSGQKEYEVPGESGQDSHNFHTHTLCGSSPYHQVQLQSVREHTNVKEQQQGSEAAQPNAPACVQSNCWLAHFEDIPDAAAPETPTRSSCPSQAAKQATWAHPFAQQQQRDPQQSDTQTACPTIPFTALPPESDALHYSDTTAACPTVPCATATPQPHTPRPGHHQLPSFSAFLSPADTAQPDRLITPVAPVCHTKACQTEYCFWPEASALDELIQGKNQALRHTEAQIDAGSPRKLDLPSLAEKHMQPTSSEHRSSRATESAVVGQQQPLQGQLQLAAPNELVQQPEGSAHMHHHLQHLLAVLHKGAQMLPAQQQQGCTLVKEQPQQQPQLSSPVVRQLMDLEGCKELQIRSQLVSALLSGVLHLRISNTSPNTQAAASAADAAGAAPPRHHLTQRLHHGYARASTFPLPGELLQVRGLGSSGSGVRARAKEGATVFAAANTNAAKTPRAAATATAGSDAANTARHGSKGEVPRAGDGCQQQDMSRLLGVVAALHHLHAPRPGLGDQMQRGLSRAVEIGQQAFWSQERRQRTSSFGHQATNRRLMLYETHS